MARRSAFRDSIEAGLASALLGVLRYTPFAFARALVWLLRRAVPRLERVGRKNVALALPGADAEPILSEMWRSLARLLWVAARFPRIHAGNVQRWIRYAGFEHYLDARARGRGVLFATAHLGNWELSAFAHALLAEPMSVVVRPLDNARLDGLVTRLRGLTGNHILGRREFMRPVVRALRANEAVGILVDQNVLADEGVFVEFFGRPACVDAGFARLAARTGAAVIPGFALWNEAEGRYVLQFYPPVEMSGDALEDTARVQAALERAIREHPGQWLWIHRRWKTRPPGEPPLY